ncbi:MAG: ABC transporter transmembrane domain-containing protein [Rhodobacteraceae bacterium]|nr:ABC transporter transmembrane domain-containing protein [Paracoccaceae bacterium]
MERSLFSFIWKYSRRDQLVLLAVTTTLFPLLYLTLELPKRIINDAIGARSVPIEAFGFAFSQEGYLALLCGAFLLSVFLHGIMKMRINTMKGVLAERLLRRFRYTLIARILRFPAPYFERTSQGELVSMVTAEAEPMGGLMGDALTQPVLQAGQMLTILAFLFLQSFWFGLAACALIPLQAWLIPKLQKQINKLNKKRVIEVRALASEIGESAAGATTLRVNGGWRHRLSMITDRLGRLYLIRFEIYQKKFFMKFLNNFITQLTPFFFFAVGGYLVIQGAVTVGALVAALAAYKDLSSPWKELLAYYNQSQDMSLRWETITERFAPQGMVDEALFEGEPDALPHLTGDVVLNRVTVRDADGNAVLEELNGTLPGGKVIGIQAASEEDRRAFAELLLRELTPTSGDIAIGGTALAGLHQGVIAARVGHATSRPMLFQGSFGENVLMPLMHRPAADAAVSDIAAEALRAGNSGDRLDVEWLDPSIAGLRDEAEVREWWIQLVEGMGSGTTLFRRGLDQKFDPESWSELAQRLVELRDPVREALEKAGLRRHVFYFLEDMYNPALPVSDNLLFALPREPITREFLAGQAGFLDLLKELRLDRDLVDLAQDVVEMLRQIFGLDGTDHPLFFKLGLDVATYETAVELVARRREEGHGALSDENVLLLLTVPFSISAEQIGPAFPEDMKQRILALRHEHAADLQKRLRASFAPLRHDEFAPGLTVLENVVFGKLSENAGGKADELRRVVAETLIASGVKRLIVELIYDAPITLGGGNLPALFTEPLAFSRAAIKKPDILILEKALASYDMDTQRSVFHNLRRLLPDTTLIYLNDKFENTEVFDCFMELRQGRFVTDETDDTGTEDSAASADLIRKLRALEKTDLFAGLDRKQLRLLAFGGRWYRAAAGEVVFYKNDPPKDGVYMVIDGEAGLYLPRQDEDDLEIARVGPGKLVGELGLIRNVPRALTMKAETDLTCLRIGAEEFLAVVENDAATAYKLLQVVAGYVSN